MGRSAIDKKGRRDNRGEMNADRSKRLGIRRGNQAWREERHESYQEKQEKKIHRDEEEKNKVDRLNSTPQSSEETNLRGESEKTQIASR